MISAVCAIGFYSMLCQLDRMQQNSIQQIKEEKPTPLIIIENEKERFYMKDEDYEYKPQYENHWLYLSDDSEKLQKPKGLYMIHNKKLLEYLNPNEMQKETFAKTFGCVRYFYRYNQKLYR